MLSAMQLQTPNKPFSRIREFHFADWFTLANAVCGTGALGGSLWFGKIEFAGFTLHPIVLLFAVSGSLMVSRMRFPKL